METTEKGPERSWYAKTITDIMDALHTNEEGLTNEEAKQRLARDGYNQLRQKPRRKLIEMIMTQIKDPMVLILIFATVFSAILQEWAEAIVIFSIVIVNAIIGIVQEKKAETSLLALQKMTAPQAHVLRDDEDYMIPASELVVGDIVIIEDGALIPADIRLIDTMNLKIQESALTGESLPVDKEADDVLPAASLLGDHTNMAYASTIVTYGRGVGVVCAVAMDTEVGKIAELIEDQDDFDTPLKRKLNSVGKTLTIVGIIVCILIFGIGFLYQRPLVPQFLIAISLAISIIPEGLPATATIVMALGVQRMAKKNALVKRLPAVETLGSASIICSDKTGTLTLNKMTVTDIALFEDVQKQQSQKVVGIDKTDAQYRELIYAASLCNDASFHTENKDEIIGDPTEGALIHLSQDFGLDHEELEDNYPRLFEQPFDSDRKMMTTVHEIDNKFTAYTKGAVDEMLPFCTHLKTANGVRLITDEDRASINALSMSLSTQALRVLGFAQRYIDEVPLDDEENIEFDMVFIGMVGMIDPPRPEIAASVKQCLEAGIRTVMITGDHKLTAQAIAKDLNIWQEGSIIISGDELDELSDNELDAKVEAVSVFARVSPADKLRIIQSLKRNGEIAAMTGDGVNDSPALKAADIGVAMGISGTDVAKDAADMILLDDNFNTITYAIKEGRRVYRNIQKVIQFLLAGNIAEIVTLFVATVFNWNAPLLAIHILWVNLATATLPSLALGVDPASKNIMKHQPVKSGTLFEKDLIVRVITQGAFVAIMTLVAYWLGETMGGQIVGQTMAFSVLAFSQMLRSLNQRSNTEPIWVRAENENPWLILAFVASGILMLAILLIPALQAIFQLTYLTMNQWFIVVGLSLASLVQMEIVKAVKRRK